MMRQALTMGLLQIFLAGHMPEVAFYTLAAVEAVGMSVTAAKVTGLLGKGNGGIWQVYLDALGVLAVAVLVQVQCIVYCGVCSWRLFEALSCRLYELGWLSGHLLYGMCLYCCVCLQRTPEPLLHQLEAECACPLHTAHVSFLSLGDG